MSIEVDIAPLRDDNSGALATRIDGLIGERSMFHQTHGFYVLGVSTQTAILPGEWQDRLVIVQGPGTNGHTGLCLDPHDPCIAKFAAARLKDFRFVHTLLQAGLIDPDTLTDRANALPDTVARSRTAIQQWGSTRTRTSPDTTRLQSTHSIRGTGLNLLRPVGHRPPAALPPFCLWRRTTIAAESPRANHIGS